MKLSIIFSKINDLYADKERWVKGDYRTFVKGKAKKQCFCLVGALAKVSHAPNNAVGTDFPGYQEFVAAIKELHPHAKALKSSIPVEAWNDGVDRTIGEIRQIVRRAHKNAVKAERIAA